ncbi:MAG: gliding motility-associated C-terminal domain-containing protein, partial [Flavobacteriales bacterium]|nr:gliding motility-associated C-terminal domain-containing protein [Flavobacteriales bacterium]
IVTDNVGCTDTAFTYIGFSPVPTINAGPNQIINFGEVATLSATSSPGTFSWAANKSLGCPNCKTTVAQPGNTTTYIATLADPYGCFVYDTVTIFLEGSLYVPNSFTPNGDGINDEFVIISEDITNFSLMIFNRWGELLYESTDIEESWDGTYKGKLSQIDTYIWKIRYSDVNKKSKDIYGHVNLIR